MHDNVRLLKAFEMMNLLLILIVYAGGMNGSIIYELERPENTGLKKSLKAFAFFFPSLSTSDKSYVFIWTFGFCLPPEF